MAPVHELLHRIQWDADFGNAAFEIGYWDRVAQRVVRVPLGRVHFAKDDRFAFQSIEDDGSVHTVPMHRVRTVWRNGEIIWQRLGGMKPP